MFNKKNLILLLQNNMVFYCSVILQAQIISYACDLFLVEVKFVSFLDD